MFHVINSKNISQTSIKREFIVDFHILLTYHKGGRVVGAHTTGLSSYCGSSFWMKTKKSSNLDWHFTRARSDNQTANGVKKANPKRLEFKNSPCSRPESVVHHDDWILFVIKSIAEFIYDSIFDNPNNLFCRSVSFRSLCTVTPNGVTS